jgi:hypothetical protein
MSNERSQGPVTLKTDFTLHGRQVAYTLGDIAVPLNDFW